MRPIVIMKLNAVSTFWLPHRHRLPIRQLVGDRPGWPGTVAPESCGPDRSGGAWPHGPAPTAQALPCGQLRQISPPEAGAK